MTEAKCAACGTTLGAGFNCATCALALYGESAGPDPEDTDPTSLSVDVGAVIASLKAELAKPEPAGPALQGWDKAYKSGLRFALAALAPHPASDGEGV